MAPSAGREGWGEGEKMSLASSTTSLHSPSSAKRRRKLTFSQLGHVGSVALAGERAFDCEDRMLEERRLRPGGRKQTPAGHAGCFFARCQMTHEQRPPGVSHVLCGQGWAERKKFRRGTYTGVLCKGPSSFETGPVENRSFLTAIRLLHKRKLAVGSGSDPRS